MTETEQLASIHTQPERFHPAHEQSARERIAAARAERDQLPEVRHEARAKVAVAEHLLAERERAAATAARLSPPDYITRELGERPSDPAKAREWDRAVRGIEGYRTRNGVVDTDSALGPRAKDPGRQRKQAEVGREIQRAQRQLGLQRQRAVERSLGREIGL